MEGQDIGERHEVQTGELHLATLQHAANLCRILALADDDQWLADTAEGVAVDVRYSIDRDGERPSIELSEKGWLKALGTLSTMEQYSDDANSQLASATADHFVSSLPEQFSGRMDELEDANEAVEGQPYPDYEAVANAIAHDEFSDA